MKKLILILIIIILANYGFTASSMLEDESSLSEKEKENTKHEFYDSYSRNPESNNDPSALYKHIKINSDLNKSIRLLNFIVRKYPDFPMLDRVLDDLGTIYFMQRKYKESYQNYQHLFYNLKSSQLKSKAGYYIAKILILNKHFEKARSFIKNVHSQFRGDPYYYNLLFLLGESYFYEKKYDKAVSTHQKIIKLSPNFDSLNSLILQIGYSNLEIKKPLISYKHLNYIIEKYPNSLESDIARDYINNYFTHKENKKTNAPKPFSNKDNGYYVQLGIFSVKENAQKIKVKANSLGLQCRILIINSSNKTLYNPLVGPFETKEKAINASKALSNKQIEPMIIKKP